jgi:hypothetical protein
MFSRGWKIRWEGGEEEELVGEGGMVLEIDWLLAPVCSNLLCSWKKERGCGSPTHGRGSARAGVHLGWGGRVASACLLVDVSLVRVILLLTSYPSL